MPLPIQRPGTRGLGLNQEMSLDEAVGISIGAASTAWSNLDLAGEFDTTWAVRISEELSGWIRDNARRLCEETQKA